MTTSPSPGGLSQHFGSPVPVLGPVMETGGCPGSFPPMRCLWSIPELGESVFSLCSLHSVCVIMILNQHLLLSVICLSCCLFVLLSVYPEGQLCSSCYKGLVPLIQGNVNALGLQTLFCSLSQPFIRKGIGGPGAELALTVSVSANDWLGVQLHGLKQGLREQVPWLRSPQRGGWMDAARSAQKAGQGKGQQSPCFPPWVLRPTLAVLSKTALPPQPVCQHIRHPFKETLEKRREG